jgi:hypothetical protein
MQIYCPKIDSAWDGYTSLIVRNAKQDTAITEQISCAIEKRNHGYT